MRSKTYICTKFLDLTTEVMVNGALKSIRFKGGITSPRRINGTYTTTDPKIQEAIEAAAGFGKRWILHRDWGEQKEVKSQPKIDTPPPPRQVEEVTITGPTPEVSTAVAEENPKDGANDDLAKGVHAETITGPIPPEAQDPPPKEKEGPEPIVGPEVTSGAKAKVFLMKQFDDVTNSMLRNNEQIRLLAKEKNVVFPKWPKE